MAAKKRKPKVKQDLLDDYVSMTHKVCKTYLSADTLKRARDAFGEVVH